MQKCNIIKTVVSFFLNKASKHVTLDYYYAYLDIKTTKFKIDQLVDLNLHTRYGPNAIHLQHVVLQQIEQNEPDL
jgi:hypothetical protein